MSVARVMTRDVVSVAPEDCAWSVGELLTRLDITGVPVVDPSHQVVGVLSSLDLLRAVRRGDDLRRTRVFQVMQRHPLFVRPDTDLRTAAELMDEWQVRRLPVCVGGRLSGIITRGDQLRAVTAGNSAVIPSHDHRSVRCGSGRACSCVAGAAGRSTITVEKDAL